MLLPRAAAAMLVLCGACVAAGGCESVAGSCMGACPGGGSCGGSHTDSGDLACHCAAPPALRDWRSQYPTENDCLYAPQPRCA